MPDLPHVRLATRGSALALIQTELAATAIGAATGEVTTEVVQVSTKGDQDRVTPLRVLGGQGVFVGAVREALLDGRADIAVHSLKDVPTAPAPGLTIAAMLERADPRDVFVGSEGRRLAELLPGSRVGTSASRRIALLRALRPDLELAEIRGNVDTRIAKVRSGEYAGVVLAAAGLERLGRGDEATQVFEAEAFLPSPGQGVIALECREDDDRVRALLAAVDDSPTRAAAEGERGVLAALGTGCNLAVGAYARIDGDLMTVRAFLGGDRDGDEPIFGEVTGAPADATTLGRGLGDRLKETYEARFGAIA